MDQLKPLFNYLDAEHIQLDKEEFDFQFNSHPDYPSLLALSDTLKFFNITNGAFKIDPSEIELLPNNFVARLKKDQTDFLSFVEKKEDAYFYTNGTEQTHSVSKTDFEMLWDDIVLLVEQDLKETKPKTKNWLLRSLLLVSGILFLIMLVLNLPNKLFALFYAFPIFGLVLSVAALKDLFKTKSKLLDKFCKATAATSCNTVVNSSKWKFLKTIGFSDLGVVFFSVQIVALLMMGLSGLYSGFFLIQTVLLLAAIPVITASLYYQKFIEKKWCPICLSIIGVICFELGYVLFVNGTLILTLSLVDIIIFFFLASSMAAIWYVLRNLLKKVNDLKAFELKANRFKRNYRLFKKMLVSSERYELPKSLLVFGNLNSNLHISIVTSPFCGHCTEPHYMLTSLLATYGANICITFLHNVNPKNKGLLQFVTSITHLKVNKGAETYNIAMDTWYDTKDIKTWLAKYKTNENSEAIETILTKNQNWYSEHDINFTPCLFVNGYRYPKEYDIADLPFFMDELVDDKSYHKDQTKLKYSEAEKL